MQKRKLQPEVLSPTGFAWFKLQHEGLKELLLRISKFSCLRTIARNRRSGGGRWGI